MECGGNGVSGPHVVYLVEVVQEQGSVCVILPFHNMEDYFVWGLIHRWIIVTVSHVQVTICTVLLQGLDMLPGEVTLSRGGNLFYTVVEIQSRIFIS